MGMKKIISIVIILVMSIGIYSCTNMRTYGKSVFVNLQTVSAKIINIVMFEEEDIKLIEQLEVYEEKINNECYALQQIGYQRMMGEPVSSQLEYEAGISLQECDKAVTETQRFLTKNGK